MATYMGESNFHRDSSEKKEKKRRVTAPQFGIVNIEGLREEYPHVNPDEAPPPWWNANIENMYRCQMAGYRDERHYLLKRRLRAVEKWPENELIKKLIRWDGLYYYFSNHRECPNLQTDDIKRAFLREPIIFENTAFRDKNLVWAPIITEQAQRFNEACDELLRTIRKPKKSKKVRSEAGPSKATRAQEEKSTSLGIKDKYLLPEENVLSEKKKSKSKKPKETRKKLVKHRSPTSRFETGDGIPSKKQSANNGKENMTQNVDAPAQCRTERTKSSEKRELHSGKLAQNKQNHFKKCGKSLSVSDFSRSESLITELPLTKKKSTIKPSTSADLKSKRDSKLSPIPVSARVAAKKGISSEKPPRRVPS